MMGKTKTVLRINAEMGCACSVRQRYFFCLHFVYDNKVIVLLFKKRKKNYNAPVPVLKMSSKHSTASYQSHNA